MRGAADPAGRSPSPQSALTPGQSFSAPSCAPPGPRPPVARRPGRSRLRPCGASLRRSHDQPCRRTLICGRLGNSRGATDSCTKMLPAWGLSLPRFFRPGRPCSVQCGQKGARDLYRKCCRKPKPPLRGDPQVCPKGKAAQWQPLTQGTAEGQLSRLLGILKPRIPLII
jgi:hypothetical protein